jgi:hypothetical protein
MKEQAKEEAMFDLVRRWMESGQSQKQFSQENNIKLHTFMYWIHKFRQSESPDQGFTALSISPESGTVVGVNPKIEIELAGGVVVRIY